MPCHAGDFVMGGDSIAAIDVVGRVFDAIVADIGAVTGFSGPEKLCS